MFFFEKIYIFRYFLEALDITKSDREARFFRFIENWMRWIRLQSFLRKLNDKTEKRIFLANLDVYDKEMKLSSQKYKQFELRFNVLAYKFDIIKEYQ